MIYKRYGKRVLDFIMSLIGICVLSPFFLVIALLVTFTSKGPVFFRQRRIGKEKVEFEILKFRTMRTDAPKDMPTHMLENPDAYITPVGKFLRRTSLDELPQLFNIIKGEMAVVGPRPALWNQVDLLYERDKYGANSIRPGLTGLAQISGRDELPIEKKAAYDGEYLSRISLWYDWKIILKTAFSVLRSEGVSEGKKE